MVRKIIMTDDHLKKIREDMNKWSSKGLETGGYLFGKLSSNGVAIVTHVLDGGPKAERTPISFSGDNEYATRFKNELQSKDPEIMLLGEFHVHPWKTPPALSHGDIMQLKEVKKRRPWFFVHLNTLEGVKVFDLELQGISYILTSRGCKPCWNFAERPREVPYQIVKTEAADESVLLDRILKITKHDVLMKKTIVIVGLGSGGSTIAKYLGCTGLGRIILIDNEELEVANLIRHEGGIADLRKPKVEICKQIIESHNPFTVVETYNLDVTKRFDKLEDIASEADLIIGSSGSNKVNNLLNKISLERRIPAIYGGVYERALGGYTLLVKPYETACYNCLFGLTSKSYSVDREAAERYGLNEDELHAQQGLWIDISFNSLILSKMALEVLQGNSIEHNLVLYYSNMEIKKMSVVRRKDCAACNKEVWIKKVLRRKTSLKKKLKSIFKKI